MFCIELHDGIQKIIDGYRRIGFWYQGDVASVKETRLKIFYSIYFSMFPISLLAGAVVSDNKYESMLLVQSGVITTVVLVRLLYTMFRQKEINEFLHRICVYSVKDESDFTVVDNKLNIFIKWNTYFYSYVVVVAACMSLGLPLIGEGRKMFFNVGFPLDYKNDEISYWIAFLFVLTEVFISGISVSFSILTWYLLLNCSLKYKVLGSELRNMGVIRTLNAAVKKHKISELEKRGIFHRDLIAAIKSHKDLNEATHQLESLFSELFSVQLGTSAACICASVYNLAFNKSDNIMEIFIYTFYLLYNIFDIFMVMYFGNEIEFSSDGLSHCLFQSNWVDQSQSCKRIIIIFGERLKQAEQLVILKLYPLTLETFTRIMNGAYSMFNILKTVAN